MWYWVGDWDLPGERQDGGGAARSGPAQGTQPGEVGAG